MTKEYPVAKARLVKDGDIWRWIVDCCPLCGKKHCHGGGKVGDDPRRLLGHRVAHCIEDVKPRGYVLVEAVEDLGGDDGTVELPF